MSETLRGRHYATGDAIEVECADGIIQSMKLLPSTEATPTQWIAPAFFDLQINGCSGIGFHSQDLNEAGIRQVIETCRSHGIAGFCPTLVTNSFEALHRGFSTLAKACANDPAIANAIPIFHLEGPYISAEDGPRGAHPREHVRRPDYDEFQRLQEAADGRIRLVTLAPEWDNALEFIEHLSNDGIVVALGHTAAHADRIRGAIIAGARLSTHLGNGSHAVLPRHENYIWEQLAADELWASVICDGHHLPASVVKCMLRVKTPTRTILTCDASPLAGLPAGEYEEWGQKLEVLDSGKVVVSGTPYLAGSGVFTDTCVRFVLAHSELSLSEVIDMAGARPRELLGLPAAKLQPGESSDLIVFRHDEREPFRLQ